MENINVQLCECGCGQPAPIASRNWHSRGIKKGQALRFVCGHHRRGIPQSREEKIKRVKKWGKICEISPYLPDNKVIRFNTSNKRWYCSHGKKKSGAHGTSSRPHARVVYEHHFGTIPEGFVVHHKNGNATNIEDDRPNNLMLVSKVWNLHYFPKLAQGFGVHERVVTRYYDEVVNKVPQDKVFKEVCRKLIEESDHA